MIIETAAAPATEVVYQSSSARVLRPGAAPGHVLKEFTGANAAARLRHEAAMLARMAHLPGVAQRAETPGSPHALGLVDYGDTTLASHLRAGPLERGPLLELACRLAMAVARVHRAGVVHRDICPANILLPSPHELVLCDFDLAVAAEDLRAPRDGALVGTLGYLAPEQTGRTGRTVDHRSDLHAVGATFYEMATGRRPFESDDALRLVHDHLVRVPSPPAQLDPRVPRMFSDIVMRLLAKEPEQRFQSADGLVSDLAKLARELDAPHDDDPIFVLGERDFAARLVAPDGLVGRDAERAVLRSAFERALAGERRTVLIEGAPGIGKTALIGELRPWVSAAGGWFVHGKSDQYQKDASATGAITQALRQLGRLLLAEADTGKSGPRQRLLEGLGANAGHVTETLPEFAALLGPQPPAAAVDPAQAHWRLLQNTVDMLAAVASAQRPLVLVIDDLQWASGTTVRVFERLMNAAELHGVVLVGAYRPEDLDPAHELAQALERWLQQEAPLRRIHLSELPVDGVAALVGGMLRLPGARALELATAVCALTGGNPFDTVEMVNALRTDGVLRLGAHGWDWDDADIRRFVGRGNVVDLLAARIAKLPTASRELLEDMSCLGNAVDADLLGAATGLEPEAVRTTLRPAVDDGLLLTDAADGNDTRAEGRFRFRHDRVQQAALAALDDAQRDGRQIGMARRLSRRETYATDAAQQYLACYRVLGRSGGSPERSEVVGQFLAMAKRLAAAALHELAERYLAAAAELLQNDDPADAPLRTLVNIKRHATLYSLGRLDEADAFYAAIEASVANPFDLVDSACLQIRSLNNRGGMQEALDFGMALLPRLGIDARDRERPLPDRLALLAGWVHEAARDADRQQPEVSDARALAQAKLITRLLRPASFRFDNETSAWLLLESQRLWAAHGPSQALVGGLTRLALTLMGVLQEYRSGYDTAVYLIEIAQERGWDAAAAEARQVFATCIAHWFEPLEDVLRHGLRAREGLLRAGDPSYACYTYRCTIQAMLDGNPRLDECEAEIEAGLALSARTDNRYTAAINIGDRQFIRAMRGRTHALDTFADDEFDPAAYEASLESYAVAVPMYLLRRALASTLFGDFESALRYTGAALPRLEPICGYYIVAHAHFLHALALANALRADERGRDPGAKDPEAMRSELRQCRSWLSARAADQPANFLHLLYLVDAESAWAEGDHWQAARAFDTAMAQVGRRTRPWHQALITERAGQFHLSQGLTQTGESLLAEARDLYAAWGASAKAAEMERTHPRMAAMQHRAPRAARSSQASHRSGTVSPDQLELMAVLRASQALSSERSLERLTARVGETLAALTGATRVCVLARHDEEWWLLGASGAESSVSVGDAANRGLLPLSCIAYAERTQQPLLVDDALADDRFAREPYFSGRAPCSLLLVPIATQGVTRALLYLENGISRAAFNASRLDAATLIAGQLAVSLENVQLYESLEQRVRLRTRELEQTQERLVATARRAGMAEIANNVLHNVGNVLNSVNTSAGLVRGRLRASRTLGLAKAVDLMNEHAQDLGEFITQDERGKVLPRYLNVLSDAITQEHTQVLGELDRLMRSVEHIKDIVARQQFHAGSSSVMQLQPVGELLDEALHLSAESLARHRVQVVRNFDELGAISLDKARLLQILVNLIRNASQAMEMLPADARKITVTGTMVSDAGVDKLRIAIRDEGVGIPPAHLTRIFGHGFTTKPDGHGFGLHSSALAAMEMGGTLAAHSEGPGKGSVFTLELPVGKERAQ